MPLGPFCIAKHSSARLKLSRTFGTFDDVFRMCMAPAGAVKKREIRAPKE